MIPPNARLLILNRLFYFYLLIAVLGAFAAGYGAGWVAGYEYWWTE